MDNKSIAILGAGSWGTAVAIHLAHAGHDVMLWGRDLAHMQEMQAERCNKRYLPNILLDDKITICSSLATCVAQASQIIIAVPSHAFAELLHMIPKPSNGLTWLTKGIDPSTHKFFSQLVQEKWGEDFPMIIISGPSFAREVATFMPTALVFAGQNKDYLNAMRALFHHGNMRIYLSHDIIGVQLCGAVKNVLAIACGISDGLQYGSNAQAAIITRGLAEMSRLGMCLGAKLETFMGLAGLGDLVLTSTDSQSRNRRFGILLGRGFTIDEAEKHIGQVVEGKYNAAQVCYLAKHCHIELPICQEIHALLKGEITAQQAVTHLMNRPPRKDETL